MNYNRLEAKILEALGQNIRKYRQNIGWSQEELAFECNLDRTYISSVERGLRNISMLNLFRIAAALNIHPEKILNGVSIPSGLLKS